MKTKNTDQILVLFQEGLTGPQIAKQLSIGESSVYRALKRKGVVASETGRLGEKGGYPRFSKEDQETLLKKYIEGASIKQLATKYECCEPTVKNAIRRLGGTLRRRGNQAIQLSQEKLDQMAAMYLKGMSQTELSHFFKISQVVVSRLLRKHGVRTRGISEGEFHGRWKGGRRIDQGGYVSLKIPTSDPLYCMANNIGYLNEHRYVMAQQLSRPLHSWETVHHIDGDRTNNKPENLQLRIGKHGKHVVYCCADCGSKNIKPIELEDT